MWSTPSSIARRSTARAPSGSLGGPNTPGPASCIAPKPMRLMGLSPRNDVVLMRHRLLGPHRPNKKSGDPVTVTTRLHTGTAQPAAGPGSAERRDHFGRQPLELLGAVAQRFEEDQLRPGLGHRAHAGGARRGGARAHVLRPAAPTVVLRERVLKPPTPARRVVVNVDIDPLSDPERVRRASLCGQLLPDHLNLFGELSRRLRAGAHEPVSVPDRAPHPRRRTAPEPDRRVRLLHRLGFHRGTLESPPPAVK